MNRLYIILSFVGTVLLLLIADSCFARAGGGGGDGLALTGAGGILMIILGVILAPFFLVYSIIVTIKLNKRRKKVKELVAELAKEDKLWNYRNMMATVEQTFFKVQQAWMERDQDLAKEVMSDRIYQKHKLQTDDMIANGTKNVLRKINMKEIMIIHVADYNDNTADTFSVFIKGSMIDYHIDVNTNALISGSMYDPDEFREIWTFIREKNSWLLDEIDQRVTLGDINSSTAYSERTAD